MSGEPISQKKVNMNYSEDVEDIFPNPDIVIEYGGNLDEEKGNEDFFLLITNLQRWFLDNQEVEEFFKKDIVQGFWLNQKDDK